MLILTVTCLLLPVTILSHPIHYDPHHVHHEHHTFITQEFIERPKRAASFDFFGAIKNHVSSSIGKASASSAAGLSGSSSHKTIVVEKPPIVIEKDFDGWALKKSILNTLFQTVKAITGGITAINGQLIKGSGYAISHGGALLAKGGDVVTDVGKKIAASAKLLPPEKHLEGGVYKYFGGSSHSGHPASEEFTSFGHDDEIDDIVSPVELPVYAPPSVSYLPHGVSFEQNFQQIPHGQYGPPLHPPLTITNYVSTDRKEHDTIHDVHDIHDIHDIHDDDLTHSTGIRTSHSYETPAHQKAVEALQLLLRKLPNKNAIKDQLNDSNDNYDDKTTIKQYEIPRDPIHIPQFKPMKPQISTTYTLQVGPINSVTKHSIGGNGGDSAVLAAAAAAVSGGNQNKYTIKIQAPNSQQYHHQQNQQSLPYAPQQQQSHHSYQPIHNSPLSASNAYLNEAVNRPPLNLYHTMSLKNGPTHHNAHISLQHPPSHPPPQLHIHAQQQQQQKQPLFYLPGEQRPFQVQGIQKSVEYRVQ